MVKIFRVYLLPTENGGPSKAASEDPCSRQKLSVFGRRPQDAQTEEHERFQWCIGYTQALPTRRQTAGSLSSLLMRKCRTIVNVVTPSIIGCACALILETSCSFFVKLRRGKVVLDLVTTNHAVMPSSFRF